MKELFGSFTNFQWLNGKQPLNHNHVAPWQNTHSHLDESDNIGLTLLEREASLNNIFT